MYSQVAGQRRSEVRARSAFNQIGSLTSAWFSTVGAEWNMFSPLPGKDRLWRIGAERSRADVIYGCSLITTGQMPSYAN